MDASSRNLLGLISEINIRFVVPVYQRPYSWDKEQCLQLWDDILACGRSHEEYHFTGSIVTIRDGSPSNEGVSSLLLIDGQQRITTFMLLLIALARYSLRHPTEPLQFSCDEIVLSGFLTNHFRDGDDHYKLTLSKGDRATYQHIVDSVEHSTHLDLGSLHDASARLIENLALFDNLLESLHDPDSIWVGLRRLEVVSILLTQGRDRPQLIFESMNSTGKDLSTADLVRNFVLMDYPVEEQVEDYRTLWAPVEEILSAGEDTTYDEAFQDFLMVYLTATCAPRSFAHADLYGEFKRYIVSRRYNENNRMRNFALKFRSFAEHYAALRFGRDSEPEIASALARINALGVEAARPLVVVLLDMHDRHALMTEELKDLLATLEAYLVRRSACDRDRSVLPKFFSSLIARLDAVFERGGDYATAFRAMLRNEDEGPLAFQTDDEFAYALLNRDAFYWNDGKFVLACLELGRRAPLAGESSAWGGSASLGELMGATVEHVGAPGSWKARDARAGQTSGSAPDAVIAQGDGAGRSHAASVDTAIAPAAHATRGADAQGVHGSGSAPLNHLGNLTLSWREFDLQDGGFEAKKAHIAAVPEGRSQLLLNEDVLHQDAWGAEQVEARGQALAREALFLWPVCEADGRVQREYRPRHRAEGGQTTFADLFDAGLVKAGDALVSANPSHPGRATVMFDGTIMLSTGERFDEPQAAYRRLLLNLGIRPASENGWLEWRRGEGGPLLDELREAME